MCSTRLVKLQKLQQKQQNPMKMQLVIMDFVGSHKFYSDLNLLPLHFLETKE